MGDLIFNPTARPGDADWRVMYIGCGDGGSGERRTAMRQNPQRLDTLVGKILRIVPDLSLHTETSTVSENGRYRIPNDNPFASIAGAKKEIWAYGLRNPHRLIWDVDPANPSDNHLLAASIGLHSWETVYFVRKGANYGYSEREGTEVLEGPDNTMAKLPAVDEIPVRISEHRDERHHRADLSGDRVPAHRRRRRRDRRRVRLSRQGAAGAEGQVHLRGHLDRPHLVRGLQGDAGGRRQESGDARRRARRSPAVEGARRHLEDAARLSVDVPGGARRVQGIAAAWIPICRGSRPSPDRAAPTSALRVDAAGELYLLSKVDGMIRAIVSAR